MLHWWQRGRSRVWIRPSRTGGVVGREVLPFLVCATKTPREESMSLGMAGASSPLIAEQLDIQHFSHPLFNAILKDGRHRQHALCTFLCFDQDSHRLCCEPNTLTSLRLQALNFFNVEMVALRMSRGAIFVSSFSFAFRCALFTSLRVSVLPLSYWRNCIRSHEEDVVDVDHSIDGFPNGFLRVSSKDFSDGRTRKGFTSLL